MHRLRLKTGISAPTFVAKIWSKNGKKQSCSIFFENVDNKIYPLSFPSLLALVGVTIEKGLHWLPRQPLPLDSRGA